MIFRAALASLCALGLGACQHTDAPIPAVLADGSDETMAALKGHLADAMGTSRIELGAGDPTQTPSVSVLPPPLTDLETRSPATPTLFNLMMVGDTCYAVREGSDERIELTGVACRAL